MKNQSDCAYLLQVGEVDVIQSFHIVISSLFDGAVEEDDECCREGVRREGC